MSEILIPGPEGRIEAIYNHNDKTIDNNIALVLHNDPSKGGTMNNKIVYNLYKCFIENNFSTLRFNFRGVGKSDGKFDGGEGELSDAAAVLDWLHGQNPNFRICWVAGFSFGSWIAMQLLMRRPEINSFICVAPPTDSRDFNFLSPCPASGLIIHGDKDEICSYDTSKILSEKLQKQKRISIIFNTIKGADHFFINYIDQLNSVVKNYLIENIKNN